MVSQSDPKKKLRQDFFAVVLVLSPMIGIKKLHSKPIGSGSGFLFKFKCTCKQYVRI